MDSQIIETLDSVDKFHKNIYLLYDDLIASIKQKTITGDLLSLTGPEGGYFVYNESDYSRRYVFKYDAKFKFIWLFVKAHENKLQSNSAGYKEICNELNINPIFPMLMIYGNLIPRDTTYFNGDHNVRRNWIENTLMLNMPDDTISTTIRSKPYEFEKLLQFSTSEGTSSWYCEESLFKLRKLMTIKNSEHVELIVDELLEF
jgi:hypothetical protein